MDAAVSELKVTSNDPLTEETLSGEDQDMRYCVTIKPRQSSHDSAEQETVLTGFISLDDAIRGAEIALAQRAIGGYTYEVVDLQGRPIDLPWHDEFSKQR